ncbi:glucose-6-phosphate isomerase [Halomonas cupida]|uniref:Glucose-6-phosphate isomerase n=1 Tax=Halomonas cupida TaxID=44933 RepID=A0A1M7IU95_9GAMM|nr:glucose-6-phosphate isomerase [Halomonas cupida]GEN24191.1 glucose-6-phosphate isomerase [Halomonas cupida]SHM44310.1 glucose-6-phosphate isomerase [Halomonas cupida]
MESLVDAESELAQIQQQLKSQASQLQKVSLSDLLTGDTGEQRLKQLSARFAGWHLDLSKQRWQPETLKVLADWADARGLDEHRQKLFAGAIVNPSERRPALHTVLRWPQEQPAPEGCEKAVAFAQQQRGRMASLVQKVRSGQWRGLLGQPVRDVIHIGVGGSDLGPRLVSDALQETHHQGEVEVHFVSTMDATQLVPLMRKLDPATTLVVLASKSFTTADTQFNLNTALTWLASSLDVSIRAVCERHLIGVSARPEKMTEFGIPEAHQLVFAEGVGGRFSLWSPIGISLAMQIGMPAFNELLAGAHAMDRHFLEAPTTENLPALLALVGAWNCQWLGIPSHAVLPYDGRLECLPDYLQQLEMESNGKSVDINGQGVDHPTCPILWGDVGPNAQHAFYQLLHQGSHTVSADFIAVRRRHRHAAEGLQESLRDQQQLTLANCLAQAQLMALGDDAIPPSLRDHMARGYRGNQPNSLLLVDELTPWSLGALLAMYEHKVFVHSVLWGLNPFDQPGVELGKLLAQGIYRALSNGQTNSSDQVKDPSTDAMISLVTS